MGYIKKKINALLLSAFAPYDSPLLYAMPMINVPTENVSPDSVHQTNDRLMSHEPVTKQTEMYEYVHLPNFIAWYTTAGQTLI